MAGVPLKLLICKKPLSCASSHVVQELNNVAVLYLCFRNVCLADEFIVDSYGYILRTFNILFLNKLCKLQSVFVLFFIPATVIVISLFSYSSTFLTISV